MFIEMNRINEFQQILEKLEVIIRKLNRMIRVKEAMNGDKLLDNHDLCMLLGVTKRTLQRYRQLEKITYYKIDGKTYYKASEIQEFLKKFNDRKNSLDS
jgi:DNA-binding transcriptional regulator YhcF (GntR family)